MPELPNNKVSPIVAIAAVSVIIFSAVGVGVMTGIIPSSLSRTGEQPVKAEAPVADATPAPAPAAEAAPAEKPKKAAVKKRQSAEPPAQVASAEPARAASREPVRTAQICANCGSVISVNVVKQQGEGSGLGAVAGGVVGGVLGNQVGQGRGRTAATVVGVGAGALAGHESEKRAKSNESYSVAVRMDDGSSRTFSYPSEPGFRAGDKVRVVEGRLVAN